MAKMEIQDSRVEFIESISRTDNLSVLRNICSQIEQQTFNSAINKNELVQMTVDGLQKVKELLGESSNEFEPLKRIETLGINSFIENMTKGYKLINDRFEAKENLALEIKSYKIKISSSNSKGRLDKVKEFEKKLYALEYPNENIKKMKNNLEILEIRWIQENIEEKEYLEQKKEIEKSILKSTNALKSLGIVTDSADKKIINLYETVNMEIREFIGIALYKKSVKRGESYFKYLTTYLGDMIPDFGHIFLLYKCLEGKRNISKDLKIRIKAMLYFTAIIELNRDLNPFIMANGVKIKINQSPNCFTVDKCEGYDKKYMAWYLTPKGYDSYIFEPENLGEQAFISAIDMENLTVDTMVEKYSDSKEKLKNEKKGLFFKFLDLETENKMLKKLLTSYYPIDEMSGEYKEVLKNELIEKQKNFGAENSINSMADLYSRIVKPFALEVLGSYIRIYCANLSKLRDRSMIYIYYISSERVGIAVRKDITEEMLEEVFDKKFISKLEKVKKPTLDEIVVGEYL